MMTNFGDRRNSDSTTAINIRKDVMAAYATHLRKIRENELLYGGAKPQPRPFTTDKDVLDTHHKFLREDNDPTDHLVKEYYESLIKDCVLVDLSRYKESQVSKSSLLG